MTKKITENQEKNMYKTRFIDGWHDQKKILNVFFDPSKLSTDGASKFLSYTLLTEIIMYLLYMVCVAEKAESSLVANGPAIEVYSDNDPTFSGQCLRRYCCEQELINIVAKSIAMVMIVYAIQKALEINDKFCGMQIAAIAVKFTGILNYNDFFHADRISKWFRVASYKCQQSEVEIDSTLIQRNYPDEIEQDYSLPTTLEEWAVWKEAALDSIDVKFISGNSQ